MNEPHTPGRDAGLTPPERKLVDDYVRASHLVGEAPAPEVRSAVLAAAARAAGAQPQETPEARQTALSSDADGSANGGVAASKPRLRVPLALAASIALTTIAVLVATRVDHEQTPLDSEPAVQEKTPSTASAPTSPRAPSPATPGAASLDRGPAVLPEPPASGVNETPRPVRESGAPALLRERAVESARDRAESRAAPAPPDDTDPVRWVERIVALRAAGRDAQADEEIRRLRERHPEIELPPAAWRAVAPAGPRAP